MKFAFAKLVGEAERNCDLLEMICEASIEEILSLQEIATNLISGNINISRAQFVNFRVIKKFLRTLDMQDDIYKCREYMKRHLAETRCLAKVISTSSSCNGGELYAETD